MTKITTIVFDLDGTLLNTLDDLADSTNYALAQFGFPTRSVEEVRRFVGNGVRKLMERAVPAGTDSERFEAVFDCFKRYYVEHCMVKTDLYPGVADLLHELKTAGYKIAIVSNKLQGGVDELYRHYFQDTVQVAVGERAGTRRKPAPDMVEIALQETGGGKGRSRLRRRLGCRCGYGCPCGASVYFCIMGFPRPGFLGTKRGRPFCGQPC